MRGLTISLRVRTLAGTDANGGPIWQDTAETVDNVLVGEPGAESITEDAGIYGKRETFLLGIPKGDTHDWRNRHVSWAGPSGRTIYGITFGYGISGVEALVPGPWHMKVHCARIDPAEEKIATIWTAGKRVTLYGIWMNGENGAERTDTGMTGDDDISLALPETVLAYCDGALLSYCGPKAYASMSAAEQAVHYTIDSKSFFALGAVDRVPGLYIPYQSESLTTTEERILECGVNASTVKFQEINAVYDDVYRVQSVRRRTTGTDTAYLEVTGR